MDHFAELSYFHLIVLLISLTIAFGFEVVNGFHDAATAVATVIYTKSLEPLAAVIWSGIWNALGVLYAMATGLAVAFSVVHLLPVDLLVSMGSATGLVMVFSLLSAAMLWNLGTWYLGLPVSSSHTLIGSVLGVGVASAWMAGRPLGDAANWAKAAEVFRWLVISPAIGFIGAAALVLVAARVVRDSAVFDSPTSGQRPPLWIRALLIFSSTGVSFAHGSNDGQKGIGLIMLVLMGTLPATYAVNTTLSARDVAEVRRSLEAAALTVHQVNGRAGEQTVLANIAPSGDGVDWRHVKLTANPIQPTAAAITGHVALVSALLPAAGALAQITPDQRWLLRQDLLRLSQAFADVAHTHDASLTETERARLDAARAGIRQVTEFAPTWVGLGVALCIGVGSMIGWRRVVVTVGEKIGSKPLSYGQGASAQLMAMGTILTADGFGMPVSTTHVLSGGVAGTMVARQIGLQRRTLTSIVTAWVVTLPASMALSAGLYTSLMSGGLPAIATAVGWLVTR